MTHIAKPQFRHPNAKTNSAGLTRRDYEGVISTLCAGCGHDSVTAAIVEACFELELPAHRVAKMSGIGCSSKTTNYFLNRSHGFNSVHGRMPSVATGANLANCELLYMGISGDGDTASIGMGQFCHAVRRRLNMVYICENNGTYGLTKGQFSATNDKISQNRRGIDTPFDAIDLCNVAIELGAGFVARAFSGDKAQVVPLIKAAINYHGFAFIDIISPCVTFNNHAKSTKSYEYVREHNAAVGKLDLVPNRAEIKVDYEPGTVAEVTMHNGSEVLLRKLDKDYDPTDAKTALPVLQKYKNRNEVATGILYYDDAEVDLHDLINTSHKPLNSIPMEDLSPGQDALAAINASKR